MIFRQDFADYVCGFIECLKHSDGRFAGKPFRLLDWQRRVLSEFYGTLEDETTLLRQYQYLYLEIPKKNGKSELAAALGLYHLFADGEVRGEVYCVAADKGNAGIIFEAAMGMLEQSKVLEKRCVKRRSTKEIVDKKTGTKMKVLSAEAYSKHGYKPSCVIFDELHAQPNRDLWDIMTFGAGDAREQPVWIVLTTAGDDPDRNSIGWEVHEKAQTILRYRNGETEGTYDNPRWLPVIYGLPDDPDEVKEIDIYDEELWKACNPSLGEILSIKTLREEAEDAKRSESSKRLFMWLRLNCWIAVKAVGWLPVTVFDRTNSDEIPDLTGMRCYGGLDLSSTTDLTAIVLLFPPQVYYPEDGSEKRELKTWVIVFWDAFTLESGLEARERRDRAKYGLWAQQGYITLCPGDCIDFTMVRNSIHRAAQKYRIKLMGVDPYLSRTLTQDLMEFLDVVEIPQTVRYLSPAMKDLETLFLNQEIVHAVHPAARYCFNAIRVYTDGNENKKPMKNRSTGRIDIIVALIIAMAAAQTDDSVNLDDHILSEDWGI